MKTNVPAETALMNQKMKNTNMQNKTKTYRAFVRFSKTYYYDRSQPIEIGLSLNEEGEDGEEEGGMIQEFFIVWDRIGTETSPQLRAYDESFKILSHFIDLFEAVTDTLSEQQFTELLLSLGFRDLTPYTKPTIIEEEWSVGPPRSYLFR